MLNSLYSGSTGIKANSMAMGVIGSNIANVNTIGFKTGNVTFANILRENLAEGGVQVWGMNESWTQGSLQSTSSATDLAIIGNGLFMVADETGQLFYTRAGAFNFDQEGNLVNENGLNAQGYRIMAGGGLGEIEDINMDLLSSPPSATNEMNMDFNLNGQVTSATLTIEGSNDYSGVSYTAADPGVVGNDISIAYINSGSAGLTVSVAGNAITVNLGGDSSDANDVVDLIMNDGDANALVSATAVGNGTGKVEISNPKFLTGGAEPSDFSTTATVYDSLGNPINLSIDFTYDTENSHWNWNARSSAGAVEGYGIIKFDSTGQLDTTESKWDSGVPADPPTPTQALINGNPEIAITGLASGAADLNITWDMTVDAKITGYASPSSIKYQSQNGYSSGDIIDVKLSSEGIVSGIFSNGKTEEIYQIGLASFSNYQGLTSIGNNLYRESTESGKAVFGLPSSDGRGAISSGALEMSNVDLADEFVNMITVQRAYQANAKVITTSDQILQDLINLKR